MGLDVAKPTRYLAQWLSALGPPPWGRDNESFLSKGVAGRRRLRGIN